MAPALPLLILSFFCVPKPPCTESYPSFDFSKILVTVDGGAERTVTGITTPSSAKYSVIFSFVARMNFINLFLEHLHVNIHSGRQRQIGQSLDGLWIRINYIYESLVDSDFELFTGVLIDKCRTKYGIFFYFGWKRHRTGYDSVITHSCIHDLSYRSIQNLALVSANQDTQYNISVIFLFLNRDFCNLCFGCFNCLNYVSLSSLRLFCFCLCCCHGT